MCRGWSVDEKLLKTNFGVRADSGSTDLARFLLKTSQSDHTSPGEWWKIKNLIGYRGDQIWRMGDSG